ncbi:MAG: PA2778 family cysteine peptidase [Halieaceae bacterium]|nr:PA2778 family cysteine peptidase [Halieaceae bacterium]
MACSSAPTLDSRAYTDAPVRVELTEVPYFPDDPYQCGPQSLAMLLTASGIATQPDALVDDVYVPGRRGSFAAELRAASRSLGRIPYQLDPSLPALVAALADGYPVLILQNLGLGFAPTWHYALVIGYDRQEDAFLLRSGPHERLVMSTRHFERRWRLGDYWAIVALAPGEMPGWVQKEQYEEQLAYLETAWSASVESVYQQMLSRWPDSTSANLGLGNIAFGRGQLDAAQIHYQQVLASDGENIAALNNLAEVYGRMNRVEDAFEVACRARALAVDHPLESAVAATLRGLQSHYPGHRCAAL